MTAPAEPTPAPATPAPDPEPAPAARPRRWRRRLLWLGLLVGGLGLAGGGAIVVKMAPIGAAYSAKTMCSAVFGAGRTEASVLAEELDPAELSSLLRFCRVEVDRDNKRVWGEFFGGLITREARYRPGYGATVVQEGNLARMGVSGDDDGFQGLALTRYYDDLHESPPWPEGEAPGSATTTPALEAALDRAFAEPDPAHPRRTRAVIVVHHGRIVAERYGPGFDEHTPQLGWSMTKTLVATLAGLLVKDGRWALDKPVPVPEWAGAGDPRGAITLRDLLHMQSGLEFKEEYSPLTDVTAMLFDARDAGGYAASKPLVHPPGTHWSYSSGTTNILCRAMRETLGTHPYAVFPGTLSGKLGAFTLRIEPDSSGVFVGSSFGWATARDWARLGLLWVQDGVWHGEQLLPPGWVAFCRTPASASGGRYGAHVWLRLGDEGEESLPADTFHAAGHDRQLLTMIPSRQLVVLRLGLTRTRRGWNQAELVKDVLAALPPEAPVSAPR